MTEGEVAAIIIMTALPIVTLFIGYCAGKGIGISEGYRDGYDNARRMYRRD